MIDTNFEAKINQFNFLADRDDDFTEVVDSVQRLAAKWPRLAPRLHLKGATIEVIKKNNPRDAQGGLHDTITEWLNMNYNFKRFGVPSWRTLVYAVKGLDNALAHEIARNHRGKANMLLYYMVLCEGTIHNSFDVCLFFLAV